MVLALLALAGWTIGSASAADKASQVAPPKSAAAKVQKPLGNDLREFAFLGQDPPVNDAQDFVFLSKSRPVLVRLHFQIDGRPYQTVWTAFMRKWFDYFDLNGDGVLDNKEAARVPTAQMMTYQFQGVIGFGGRGNNVSFTELDKNKDGKVSWNEFADYYRRNGISPLHISLGPDRGTSDKLTEALFQHLDLDKDGKLSQAEILAAPASLQKLDLDEDEIIGADELVASFRQSRFGFVRQAIQDGVPAALTKSGFIMLNPGEPLTGAAAQILNHYDADKNRKLSLAESGLDKEAFDRLDVNKDGQLDAGELAKWLGGPADVELRIRLGTLAARANEGILSSLANELGKVMNKGAAIEVIRPAAKGTPLAGVVRIEGPELARITLGDARLDLQRNDTSQFRYGGNKQFYLQQFKAALGNKKYMEKKDGMSSPYFQGIFELADRDGDGKLYEKELVAYLDLQTLGGASFTVLTLTDYGRGLFELFDTNNDGRLSQRELRNGWSKISPYCRAGSLSRTDLPRQFQLMVSQGQIYFQSRFANNQFYNNPYGQRMVDNKKGPLWFRKMDRNGDGDVSPNEFLGSPEDFKRIDTDGDGLIDAKEAERADGWFKERLQAKQAAAAQPKKK
jgi:Ca2+-binding EF-hand superfamily protein